MTSNVNYICPVCGHPIVDHYEGGCMEPGCTCEK